jgi:hypothetical protein
MMMKTENELIMELPKVNFKKVDDYKFIFEPLVYFSIFSFPLTLEEIYLFNQSSKSKFEIENTLNILVSKSLIFKTGRFFQLEENLNQINNRLLEEKRFEKNKYKIKRIAGLIACFPYVESICLSGSLSKGIWGKDTDIDFFIITKKNNLWLCRTLLILFKKIFLFNSKKNFCINYLISNDNLLIPDKNIFTSIEISTLQNLYGERTFYLFMKENQWYKSFLPNSIQKEPWKLKPHNNLFSKLITTILSPRLANSMDTFLLNKTLYWWKKKFANTNSTTFNLDFRSLKSSSKHHPRSFQKVVLEKYESNLKTFFP